MKYWHWPNNTHAAHTHLFPLTLVSRNIWLAIAVTLIRRLSRWPLSVSRVKMPAEDGLSGIGALWHGQLEINSTCQLSIRIMNDL